MSTDEYLAMDTKISRQNHISEEFASVSHTMASVIDNDYTKKQ